ncbi:MAG: 2OG-Fe(II) oxygenase [Bryobacteraceae bacterium]|jgi:hypothetical protein
MIQLTQTAVLTEPGDIPRLSDEFAQTGCALLPGFLAPGILQHLLDWIEGSQFVLKDEVSRGEVFGTTLFVPPTDRSWFLLHFLLNRPALFKFAEQVASCAGIANFIGRLHRTGAGTSQHIDWHDDAVDNRTLGICINLGREQYAGGTLQIRDPDRAIRAEIGRGAPGDAFLFRIDHGWEHRLTPVKSGRRTVGVGWFRTQPDWRAYAMTSARTRQILTGDNAQTQGAIEEYIS